MAVLVIVALTLTVPSVLPQTPIDETINDQLEVDMTFPNGPEMTIESYDIKETFIFRVHDLSSDAAPNGGQGNPHNVRVSAEAISNPEGWEFNILGGSFQTVSGQSQDVRISVTPSGNAVEQDLRLRINVTMEAAYCGCGHASAEALVLMRSPGSEIAFLRTVSDSQVQLRPDDMFTAKINVVNPGLVDRSYASKIVTNSCDLFVSEASVFVPAGETREIDITVLGPSDKLIYRQQTCSLGITMVDQVSSRPSNAAIFNVIVQGTYVDPGWVINFVVFLAIAGAIVWFVLAAKRRAEEEILGKPQPPWTLPAEQVYLTELQKKDPQAAYVVRNFLMEDEYASSLLWYKAYKKATRGRRATERKVLKLEHAFEKWDVKQQRKLDKGDTKADKKVDKLQARLDKKVNKAHKKDLKAWRKQVARLETQVANEHNKAMGEWRKEAKKAKKAGGPEPAQPARPSVDFPPEPQEEPIALDDHKWAAKKDRILERSAKKEERAEARYETARAKRLEAMRKRMERLAQKIDDPEFIEEHPLLLEAQQNAASG